MNIIQEDEEFESIIKDINESEEFQKTKDIVHHFSNRYDHCRRVAYYSYLVTKKLHLSNLINLKKRISLSVCLVLLSTGTLCLSGLLSSALLVMM